MGGVLPTSTASNKWLNLYTDAQLHDRVISLEARPLDALSKARDKKVIVELKNGKQYVGVLKAFDIHINVVLDTTEERLEGEVKRKLGTAFIRGDTIILISPAP